MPDLATPKQRTQITNITRFDIRSTVRVFLDVSAEVEVELYDGETFVGVQLVKIEGEAYQSWGADDAYILAYVADWIAQNL